MVTLLFILIAYAIRRRFLPEDASRWEKLVYYSVCIVTTPLFGPMVYKWLTRPNSENGDDEGGYGHTYPGFL